MTSDLEVIATDDIYENDPNSGVRFVNEKKLPSIYKELREDIFIGDPIQQNQGDNNLVFKNEMGTHGNYGWQLFNTEKGTAMLEYQGRVSYWPHERRPLPVSKEEHLRYMKITFHQPEESVDKAKEIVQKHTKQKKETANL